MHDKSDIEAQKVVQRLYGELGRWQDVADRLEANPGLLWRIAKGKRPAPNSLRMKLGLPRRVTLEVPPGIAIIGEGEGLLGLGEWRFDGAPNGDVTEIRLIPMLNEEWRRHAIECIVCGKLTPRWSPTQRYCPAHSWSTPAGRRWQRANR